MFIPCLLLSSPPRSAPFMHPKAFLFAVLFSFAGGLPSAHGQAKANDVFTDPDEMRLLVPTSVAHAANLALSPTERAWLCAKGRGFIEFRFQVDGKGRVEAITGVRLHQAAQDTVMKSKKSGKIFYLWPS